MDQYLPYSLALFCSLFASYLLQPFTQSQLLEASCDINCNGRLQTWRSLFSLLFTIINGYMSDIYGRKLILLCGFTSTLFSLLISLQKPTSTSLNLAAFFSSLNQNPAIVKALYSDYAVNEQLCDSSREKYFGYIGTAAGLAYMIAPVIAPHFACSSQEVIPYSIGASLLSISILFLSLRVPSPPLTPRSQSFLCTSPLGRNPILVSLLLVIRFAMGVAYSLYNNSIGFYFASHYAFTPFNYSLYMFWIGFSYTLSQAILGRYLINKFSQISSHFSSLLIISSFVIVTSRFIIVSFPPYSDPSGFLFSYHHLILFLSVLASNTALGIINILISLIISKIAIHPGTLYGLMEAVEKISSGIVGSSVVGYLYLQDELQPIRFVALIYTLIAGLVWLFSQRIDGVFQPPSIRTKTD